MRLDFDIPCEIVTGKRPKETPVASATGSNSWQYCEVFSVRWHESPEPFCCSWR